MTHGRNQRALPLIGPANAGTPTVLSLIVAFALASFAPAVAGEKEDGFVPLFNGRDLTGWKEVQGRAGSFRVENGVIVGNRHETDKQRTAYWLSTADQYGNFVLRLDYQLPKDGNSGVFLRVPSYTGRTSQVGMEIQLMDDVAAKNPPTATSTGSVYQVAAAKRRAQKPAGEWNELEITCDGDRVAVTINGVLVNDVRMDQHDNLKSRPRSGYLGVSAHTREVKFRKVRIKRLPEESARRTTATNSLRRKQLHHSAASPQPNAWHARNQSEPENPVPLSRGGERGGQFLIR